MSSDFFTTLLHAAGHPRKYFGVHDAILKGQSSGDGPLDQLLG